MKLDKGQLNQFETISPPMRDALTLPIRDAGGHSVGGMCIYVGVSAFAHRPATRRQVRCLADELRLVDPQLVGRMRRVLKADDSHDDIRDTLIALYEALTGEEAPEPGERS